MRFERIGRYDVTGAWRIKDNGAPIDATGELYDGTPVQSAADLRAALLGRPIPIVRTFTENLMAYALGGRLEYYDMPTVRDIVRPRPVTFVSPPSFLPSSRARRSS